MLTEVEAVILECFTRTLPLRNIHPVAVATKLKARQTSPFLFQTSLEWGWFLWTSHAVYILKKSCPCHVIWNNLGLENPNQLVKLRPDKVMEVVMLQLPPEVLNTHSGVPAGQIGC